MLLFTALALAASPVDACLAAARSTMETRDCLDAELKRQDDRLNTAYKQVMAASDAEGQAILKKAELAWIAFRDADCAWVADENRGGTLAGISHLGCVVDMTRERADDLEARLRGR